MRYRLKSAEEANNVNKLGFYKLVNCLRILIIENRLANTSFHSISRFKIYSHKGLQASQLKCEAPLRNEVYK